jgi:hypothetical protein
MRRQLAYPVSTLAAIGEFAVNANSAGSQGRR